MIVVVSRVVVLTVDQLKQRGYGGVVMPCGTVDAPFKAQRFRTDVGADVRIEVTASVVLEPRSFGLREVWRTATSS